MNITASQIRQLRDLVGPEKQGRFQQIFADAFTFVDVTPECSFKIILCDKGVVLEVYHKDAKAGVVGMSNKPLEIFYANHGVYHIENDNANRIHVSFCSD
jgi:hypothetical protein